VSWIRDDGGYQLFCNRDEQRTRALALLPQIQQTDGTRFLAPIDGEAGGTWITVNHHGLSLCLLNGHVGQALSLRRTLRPPSDSNPRSRGLLLPNLTAAASIPEACQRALDHDLSQYAPFTLLLLQPSHTSTVIDWNGQRARVDTNADSRMPLISSSFDLDGVQMRRRNSFQRVIQTYGHPSAPALAAFHLSHDQGPSAYSPCMHRYDAETVSFSWIQVTRQSALFRYQPSSPCRASQMVAESLVLKQ
jgi:hypothetical protein